MKVFCLLIIGTVSLIVTPQSVLSQSPAGTGSQSQGSGEPSEHDLYMRFLDTYRIDSAAGFEAANEYIRRYPQDNVQTQFLRKWIASYIEAQRLAPRVLLRHFIEIKRFNEGFALGRIIIASEPDDVETLHTLIDAGVEALMANNNAFNYEAINYAKSVLKLIESGKLEDHDGKTRGRLNLNLGLLTIVSAPAESERYLAQAMRSAHVKTDPLTYSKIAHAILAAIYQPLFTQYELRFITPEQRDTAPAEAMKIELNRIADEVVDALARAVALANSDQKLEPSKKLWMATLTHFYENRNSGYDTGLPEFIEGILKRPLRALIRNN